jgi:hypothetical protein
MITKWTNNRFEAQGVPGLVSVAPFPKDSEEWDTWFVAVPGLFTIKAKGVLKANERPEDQMLFMSQQKFDISRTGSDEVIKCTMSSHYFQCVENVGVKKAKVEEGEGQHAVI